MQYLQLLRQNNLDSLASSRNDDYKQGKLQGEIAGYDEVIEIEQNLSKYELKENKLQIKKEERKEK